MENIHGLTEIDDPFYRYRMNLCIYVQYKNSMVIENFTEVCKDIRRQPELVRKYIQVRLGMKCKLVNKTLVLPRKAEMTNINNALYEFIEYFVLCSVCNLPETVLNKNVQLCESCGAEEEIVDNKYTKKVI